VACTSASECSLKLYESADKFRGPCLWPSFRRGFGEKETIEGQIEDAWNDLSKSLHRVKVPKGSYNNYTCDVWELYCGKQDCKLFLGHQFADGKETGDGDHADATGMRHCVLSLSMRFEEEETSDNVSSTESSGLIRRMESKGWRMTAVTRAALECLDRLSVGNPLGFLKNESEP